MLQLHNYCLQQKQRVLNGIIFMCATGVCLPDVTSWHLTEYLEPFIVKGEFSLK